MANYPDGLTKTVRCRCGNMNIIPLQTTLYTCSTCGMVSAVMFFGTIIDKHGDYVYQTKIEE